MTTAAPSASSPKPSALDAARGLFPLIAGSSERIEADRRLPEPVVTALQRSGLFRLCVPRSLGGLEAPPTETIEAIAEIARADGSAGWCVAIGATSGILSGYLPEADAREIYGSDPLGVSGGVFAPRGAAVADGEFYRVSGRWPFASGVSHCTWLMGGCTVTGPDGNAAMLPGGLPDVHLLLFPATETVVHDTWSVSGLCGTGSHDIEVKDLRVPRARAVSLATGVPREPSPLYRFPVFGCLAICIAAVSLGIARRAIEELVELAGGKVPTGSRKRLADRGYVQIQVAQAEAAERSARAFLVATVAETYDEAARDGEISLHRRALLRLAACHAVQSAKQAVDAMYEAGGGTSLYRSSALQRCLRDVHAATQHLMVSSSTLELAGRVLCGLEVDSSHL